MRGKDGNGAHEADLERFRIDCQVHSWRVVEIRIKTKQDKTGHNPGKWDSRRLLYCTVQYCIVIDCMSKL